MDPKQEIEEALKDIQFHYNWDIEKTSKSFQSIKQSIEEHLQDIESFKIEVRLLESYLYMSNCKGLSEVDISKARKKNNTAFALIERLDDGPIKDGYKSICLAMRCWFSVEKDQPDISSFQDLKHLLKKYQDEVDKRKFQASICVTKALALSKLSFSRYNESERLLVKATETSPTNAEWLFMLGLIKFRRCRIKLKKDQYSSNLIEVERIMKNVLELKWDHAYAMVILADIQRRKYEEKVYKDKTQSSKTNVSNFVSENDYDGKVISLLTWATDNASRPKIMSLVAQCYIRMGCYMSKGIKRNSQQTSQLIYFQKAHDVIDLAKKKFTHVTAEEVVPYREQGNVEELTFACVIAQEAVLYREQGYTEKELECLDEVIRRKPSNVGARIQKAQALLNTGRRPEAFELYDNLLAGFKDHPFDLFDINRNYASSLAVMYNFDEAYKKNKACLKIALDSFVKENSSEQAGKEVKFIEEEEEQVQKVIGHIKKHFNLVKRRSKKISEKINSTLELAKFHEKIGRYKDAFSDYNEALLYLPTGENHDKNQEIDILLKITNVHIKLNDLSNAEKMLEEIKDVEEKHKDNINKLIDLEIDLEVAKGEEDAKSGEHTKAIDHFACATKMGSVEGAKRLFREIQEEPNHQDFIKNCALVKKCIMPTSENGSMLDDLNELVRSYDDGCLKLMHSELQKIRECQLEMEYGYLLAPENTENIATVIHKCRSILNYVMIMFRNCNYPKAKNKDKWKDDCDFFIVHKKPKEKEIQRNIIKQRIVKRVKDYGWTNFDTDFSDLLDYLVSIQPLTDPKNNWIKELIDLDNVVKHKQPLQEATKSMDIARNACCHIRPILEKFCKFFDPQATSPPQTKPSSPLLPA
ncbi:uncharacterized protein LOC117109585 isoform X2 [Anneissia japonica]|nr:uncharacterized protein LOC117109585 isoform X2 [Anneissia japonica]